MSKTIEEIKNQWAKDHSYENYFEFLNLTRKFDTDHVFIMDGAVTQIAKRYTESQTQDLQDQNAELVEMLEDVKGYLGSDKRNEVDTLLTKHNHLNKM